MKKIVTLVLFLSVVFVNAQDKEAFRKDASQLVGVVLEPVLGPMIAQYSSMVKPDKVEDFATEINESMPKLTNTLSSVYMEEFSHEEIKGILKFFKSDLGKKYIESSKNLQQKIGPDVQEWMMKLQDIISKYQ